MRLQGKLLQDVTWEDLQALVDNQVPESPGLEYKEAIAGWSDAEKKELLADISALANTSGGVVLFGVSEKKDEQGKNTDLPEALVGMTGPNPAEVQRRLEQVIRSGLDPPLGRFLIRPFPIPAKDAYVLAVGVPASLQAPHAVAFATTMPFWRRAGSIKYSLRTHELRQVFLERERWEVEAEGFRFDRVMQHRA